MKQQERTAATRRALLQGAHTVFARRGYYHAGLREIAEAAGVSKGALYHNFASKEDLFLALLDERMNERIRDIRAAFANEQSEAAQVERAALDYVENLRRNREWIALFFEFLAHAGRDAAFGARFAAHFKRFWSTLGDVVDGQARQRGTQLPLPAEHLAIAIDVLGIGFMIRHIVDPDSADDLFARVLTFLLQGVADAASG